MLPLQFRRRILILSSFLSSPSSPLLFSFHFRLHFLSCFSVFILSQREKRFPRQKFIEIATIIEASWIIGLSSLFNFWIKFLRKHKQLKICVTLQLKNQVFFSECFQFFLLSFSLHNKTFSSLDFYTLESYEVEEEIREIGFTFLSLCLLCFLMLLYFSYCILYDFLFSPRPLIHCMIS